VAAPSKPFEADKVRWQRGCNVGLTLDGYHGIFFSAHHKGRALHARKVRQHVEPVCFPTWPCEPLENICICNRAARNVGFSGSAGVKRKCDAQPAIKHFLVGMSFEEPPASHSPDLWTSQFLEHRDLSVFV
jgi:hypothetical protein